MRKGISSGVVLARDMPNVLGELRNVHQMLLLLGRPGSRKPAQGVAERLVDIENKELPALQH